MKAENNKDERKRNTMNSEYYICTRLKLLDFLQKKGFEVLETIPDAKNPKYRCWIFARSNELLDAVTEYYRMAPKKNQEK